MKPIVYAAVAVVILLASALAQSVDDIDLHRRWLDVDENGDLHVSRVDADPTSKWVRFHHTANPDGFFAVELTNDGIRSVDRIDAGDQQEVFVFAGTTPAGAGFVEVVSHNGFNYSPPVILVSDAYLPIMGAGYSPNLNKLFLLAPTYSSILWGDFVPTAPHLGPLSVIPVELSAFPDPTAVEFYCGDYSEVSGQELYVTPINDYIRGEVYSVTRVGAVSCTGVPASGGDFGFAAPALEQDGAVALVGPPSTGVEIYSARTGQVLGTSTTDAAGQATVTAPISAGLIIGVRDSGAAEEAKMFRTVFKTYGSPEVGGNGVAPSLFGSAAASNIYSGNQRFGLPFFGVGPNDGQQRQYIGYLLVGYESDVLTDPPGHPGRTVLYGPGVTAITSTIHKQVNGFASGRADFPIPTGYAGLRICFQWAVSDGSTTVLSNIACVVVQSDNWLPESATASMRTPGMESAGMEIEATVVEVGGVGLDRAAQEDALRKLVLERSDSMLASEVPGLGGDKK